MAKVVHAGLKAQTGFTASEWAARLNSLYNAAKRRNGGNSLSIYGRVSEMGDYLAGWEELPEHYDLGAELNNLAGELRRA